MGRGCWSPLKIIKKTVSLPHHIPVLWFHCVDWKDRIPQFCSQFLCLGLFGRFVKCFCSCSAPKECPEMASWHGHRSEAGLRFAKTRWGVREAGLLVRGNWNWSRFGWHDEKFGFQVWRGLAFTSETRGSLDKDDLYQNRPATLASSGPSRMLWKPLKTSCKKQNTRYPHSALEFCSFFISIQIIKVLKSSSKFISDWQNLCKGHWAEWKCSNG